MRRAVLAWALALLALAGIPVAAAASPDPFIFTPEKGGATEVPPAGYLEGPCGLAVDGEGNFYVADYGHNAVDLFGSSIGNQGQLAGISADNGPCGLAADAVGRLYVNELHGAVLRFNSTSGGGRTTLDPGPATGVAAEPLGGQVFVDDRTHISVYGPTGAPVEVAGQPLHIGEGSLQDGYGVAVSAYPATEGFLYVPDAATDTLKVYDPATDSEEPVAEIDPGFTSLRDAAVAVDDETGEIYVLDDLQPGTAESPEAAVRVFAADGSYEGRLKYNVIDARPAGLAVDNSGGSPQGRVYVTSGQSEKASVMLYQQGAAGSEARPAPPTPAPLPPAQGSEAPLPEPPPPVTCAGDSCQQLPSEPGDPTLTTLLEGSSNPPVRYFNTNRLPHYATFRGHHHKGRRAKKRSRRATASEVSIVQRGNLQLKVSGGISPTRLPREGTAPISVSVAGQISTIDESPPPALRGIEIDLNRQGHLETTGLPLCRVSEIHPASTARALENCRPSLVGTGSFSVDVVLAGQAPYPTKGRLLLFNGTYNHHHALLGQIYSAHPFASSFVIPFLIDKKPKGRYGLVLSAKLPQALISWGRVTGLEMKLRRRYGYRGERRSFISAGCPAPKGFGGALFILARTSFRFEGAKLSQTLTEHCGVSR